MENTAIELMRNYINSQKFTSTSEIMEAMKGLFRDALQQVMEHVRFINFPSLMEYGRIKVEGNGNETNTGKTFRD